MPMQSVDESQASERMRSTVIIPFADKNNYKLEPLSKYDEGRIKYYERDQEIVSKLANKTPVSGYTRFKQDGVEEWVCCEVLRFENPNYLVYIPSLGK